MEEKQIQTEDQPIQDVLENALQALSDAGKDQRLQFLKRLFVFSGGDELNNVKKICTRQRTRISKQGAEREPQPEPKAVEVPAKAVVVPARRSWFNGIKPENVVAFDCEFVRQVGTKFNQLATIAVVDGLQNVIVNETVRWIPGSFEVNKYTIPINGFKPTSLVNGKSFEEVKNIVLRSFENKLIITCGGAGDWAVLNEPIVNHQTWDLQNYFKGITGYDNSGIPVWNGHSLRTIYFNTLKTKMPAGVHSAVNDAIATMRIFKWLVTQSGLIIESKHEYDDYSHWVLTT